MKKLMCGVLIVVMMLSLVACSGIRGTYKSTEIAGVYVTYTFSGSKVTFKSVNPILKDIVVEGTYKIDGDKITLTWEEDGSVFSSIASLIANGTVSYEKTEKGIKIAGMEYTKV